MDERTEGQLRVIRKVIAVTQAADIPAWLFGGWGLDARIGRITREHGDVELWVERIHAERSKAVLVGAGATALTTQPPAPASTAFDRSAARRSSQNSMSPCSRVIRPILASRPQPPNSHAEIPAAPSAFATALMTRSCAAARLFTAPVCPRPYCPTTTATEDLIVSDGGPQQRLKRAAPSAGVA